MRTTLRPFLLLLTALLSSTAALGQEQQHAGAPTMRWMVQDIPPAFSYPTGRPPQRVSDLGNGEVDGFLRLLIGQMPQYRHEFVEAGLPRFEALVRQGQGLCSLLHVRTPERLSWLYFTHLYPPLLSRQLHVVVRSDRLARFEVDGQALQLSELLRRRDMVGLLPKDRAFGPRIDALLLAQGERAPKRVVAGRTMNLLPMLRAGRMDYTLEYPAVLAEFLHGGSGGGGSGGDADLVALPIAEGRSTPVATAACGRNPEGRRAIEAIDAAVRRLAQDPQREALLRSWRGDQQDEQDRQRLHRYMDERARGGAQIE
ncbi:hypothetical protein [Roseateles violae]|uniref:Solute-binding protein family 3/N-terminal domain-containing protein n=1 Tax=Roseateles violae TaxID=3058042 RepID=A0ABT8DKS6_9BURK|nr:hypothetical protein [Pelomonas sp. PFR6]MDN3919010.1 hypothetical protein [Pelomonas sp. PFR6]